MADDDDLRECGFPKKKMKTVEQSKRIKKEQTNKENKYDTLIR